MMSKPSLSELQNWFIDVVHQNSKDESLRNIPQKELRWINETSEFHRRERIRVYTHAYIMRLHDFIEGEYPVTKALLGDCRFFELVSKYYREHPSTSPYLMETTKKFPSFIDSLREFEPGSLMRDLIQFEYKLNNSQYAKVKEFDREHFLERIQTTPPDALHLKLNPSVKLVESDWPLIDIYESEKVLETYGKSHILIYQKEGAAFYSRIKEWQHQLLSDLANGSSLGQAFANLLESDLTEPMIQAAFATFIEKKVFV